MSTFHKSRIPPFLSTKLFSSFSFRNNRLAKPVYIQNDVIIRLNSRHMQTRSVAKYQTTLRRHHGRCVLKIHPGK